MRCSACGEPNTIVKDSRPHHLGIAIRRRRMCEACGHRFTTQELDVSDEGLPRGALIPDSLRITDKWGKTTTIELRTLLARLQDHIEEALKPS